MRKFFISIALVLTLTVNSYAFLPLAIPPAYFIASAILHTAVVAAVVAYAMQSGAPSSVATTGDIKRPSTVAWVDLTLPSPAVVQKPVTATMPAAKVFPIGTKKNVDGTAKYPNVNNALNVNPTMTYDTVPSTTALYTMPDGSLAKYSGSSNVGCTTSPFTPYNIKYSSGWGMYLGGSSSLCTSASLPIMIKNVNFYSATYANSAATMQNSATDPTVNTLYQAELDQMFQDPDYVPTFSDATTGLPFTVPTNAATQPQINAYNAKGVALEAAHTAADVAAANNTQAQAAAAAANAAAAAAGGTDAGLNAAAAAANAAAAQASNTAATTAADAAAADAAAGPASLSTPDTLHKFSFSSLNALKGALNTTWPFNLVGTISGYYSAFVATPVAPVFDYPLPLGFVVHADLSPWNTIASIMRWVLSVLLTVGCIYYIIHFWRGIS